MPVIVTLSGSLLPQKIDFPLKDFSSQTSATSLSQQQETSQQLNSRREERDPKGQG
jgi:hypothetical protein